MQAGIAIKPKTSVDVLWNILENPVKEEVPDVSPANFAILRYTIYFSIDKGPLPPYQYSIAWMAWQAAGQTGLACRAEGARAAEHGGA